MHLLVAGTIWLHRFILLVSFGFTFLLPDIATAQTATAPTSPLHNTTRLTSDGDNGEAYFNWDDIRLIWQSNRGGYACDKIWTMRLDGSDKRRVSPDHGAHTCLFFFPGNTAIVYASTSQLPGACPPKPTAPASPGSHLTPCLIASPCSLTMAPNSSSHPTARPPNPAPPIFTWPTTSM